MTTARVITIWRQLPFSWVLVLAAPCVAQVSQVDLAPAADATIYEGGALLANGSGAHLFAGKTNHAEARRTVIRFDVAGSVPAGSRVIAAELRLTIDRTFYFASLPVHSHRLLSSWSEGASDPMGGEGGGAPAGVGDCTWQHRANPTSLWFALGGDFEPVPSSTATTPSQLGPVTWPSTPRMVLDVQSWLDAPTGNHGWILLTDEALAGAVRRFASRSSGTPADRPQLRIRYLQPGSVATFSAGCHAGSSTMTAAGTLSPATTLNMVLQGGPGASFGVILLSLGVVEAGLPVFSGCSSLLDAGTLIPVGAGLLDASNQLTWPIAIPMAPAFTGLMIAAQSLVDAPGTAFGMELSAAAAVVLP